MSCPEDSAHDPPAQAGFTHRRSRQSGHHHEIIRAEARAVIRLPEARQAEHFPGLGLAPLPAARIPSTTPADGD